MSNTIDSVLGSGLTLDAMKARYVQLCKLCESINKEVAPLKEAREKINVEIQNKQAEANALSDRIHALRGGDKWLKLKREIGLLAKAMPGGR